jgi:DNA repair protein RecO (recombination protein O)
MRVDREAGFLLHKRAYRESSALLEVFTQNYGRVGLVHRGSRRNVTRGDAMQPFYEMELSWSGRGELFTLTRYDVISGTGIDAASRVMCGLYLNELILHMMPRMLPCTDLYRCYAGTMSMMSGTQDLELLLRRFEMRLLVSTGYGLQLEHEAEHSLPIDPDCWYLYDYTRGPLKHAYSSQSPNVISGKTLIWLRSLKTADKNSMREAKRLLRAIIDYHLDHRPLQSRNIMKYLAS